MSNQPRDKRSKGNHGKQQKGIPESMQNRNNRRIKTTKETYMASQMKLRSEMNKAESTMIEERLKKYTKKP